jgi:hypothetical protein
MPPQQGAVDWAAMLEEQRQMMQKTVEAAQHQQRIFDELVKIRDAPSLAEPQTLADLAANVRTIMEEQRSLHEKVDIIAADIVTVKADLRTLNDKHDRSTAKMTAL